MTSPRIPARISAPRWPDVRPSPSVSLVARAVAEVSSSGVSASLASGGAIYIRDPHSQVTADQLNGGEFAPLTVQDWELIRPYLEENESLFGITLERLLTVDGSLLPPARVYRKIRPVGHKALMPEEMWVKREA